MWGLDCQECPDRRRDWLSDETDFAYPRPGARLRYRRHLPSRVPSSPSSPLLSPNFPPPPPPPPSLKLAQWRRSAGRGPESPRRRRRRKSGRKRRREQNIPAVAQELSNPPTKRTIIHPGKNNSQVTNNFHRHWTHSHLDNSSSNIHRVHRGGTVSTAMQSE